MHGTLLSSFLFWARLEGGGGVKGRIGYHFANEQKSTVI